MALRPFAFGLRLRDKSRTVRVMRDGDSARYVVEESSQGVTLRRKHASASEAVKDAAQSWRSRLH